MSKTDIPGMAWCRGGVTRATAWLQSSRRRGFAAIALASVISVSAGAQDMVPICHARPVNVRIAKAHMANADAAGASLCLYRGPLTVHLEVRQTPIAAILSALRSAYQISYRSSIPLTEIRSGRYTGRVQSVIADVLDGYDYAIRHKNSNIEVIVFARSGGQAVPAAQPAPVSLGIEAKQTAAANEVKKTRGEVTVSRSH